MINTSGYPHSLPIHSSAFTVPNFLKASQGGSLLPASLVLQHLFLGCNSWVCFLYPESSVLCSWNLPQCQLGTCRVGWQQAYMKKSSMSQNCPIPPSSLQSPWVLGQAEVFPAGAAQRLALS